MTMTRDLLIVVSVTCCATIAASEVPLLSHLVPVSTMSMPGQFHFLQVPRDEENDASASCGDGTPFSFMFKRGSNANLNKVVVEFGGGPACWNDETCDSLFTMDDDKNENHLRTPWYSGLTSTFGVSPPLATCSGLPTPIIQIFSSKPSTQAGSLAKENLFGARTNQYAYGDDDNKLFRDAAESWSYIYVPHCTADAHLGTRPDAVSYRTPSASDSDSTIYHRGGRNLLSVISFLERNFPKLEALLTLGCGTGASFAPTVFSSEVALRYQNKGTAIPQGWSLADSPHESRALLASETYDSSEIALGLWGAPKLSPFLSSEISIPSNNNKFYKTVESLVSSTPNIRFGFYGLFKSDEQTGSMMTKEVAKDYKYKRWLDDMEQNYPNNFFSLTTPLSDGSGTQCQFAFSAASSRKLGGYEDWLEKVTSNYDGTNEIMLSRGRNAADGSFQPTFLFAIAIAIASMLFIWVVYHIVLYTHSRRAARRQKDLDERAAIEGEDPISIVKKYSYKTPLDLWLEILTRFPILFLIVALAIPVLISYLGFQASNRTLDVNVDFETYLGMNSDETVFGEHYDAAVNIQKSNLQGFKDNCEIVRNPPVNLTSTRHRHLAKYPKRGKRLDIFYQSPDWTWDKGANVFTNASIYAMKSLEDRIKQQPDWKLNCYQIEMESIMQCAPFWAVTDRFFDNEGRLKDIDGALIEMLEDSLVTRTDTYFSLDNLASNYSISSIYLRDGVDTEFLKDLHRNVLWPADQNGDYPDVVFSWKNRDLEKLESTDALRHDAYWSAGTILVVGIIVFLKIRNIFIFSAAMIGLILAFPAAFYWYYVHFEIRKITVMNVSALFVMLGIGADDVFLMVDSYAQADVILGENTCPKDKMKWAYKKAGGTMLVTTVSSAVCFYSNVFSVMLVVREFGVYMGTVVVLNYLHVMTILPSAILVNDLHLAPLVKRIQRVCWTCWICPCICCVLPGKGLHGIESATDGESDSSPDEHNEIVLPDHLVPTSTESMSPMASDDVEIDVSPIPMRSVPTSDDVDLAEPVIQEAQEPPEQNEEQTSPIDVNRMNWFDRWLYSHYAPFIYRWRWIVITITLVVTIVLGYLAYSNFVVSEKSFIVFKNDYNLGRITTIHDKYFKEFSDFSAEDIEGQKFSYTQLLTDITATTTTTTTATVPATTTTMAPSTTTTKTPTTTTTTPTTTTTATTTTTTTPTTSRTVTTMSSLPTTTTATKQLENGALETTFSDDLRSAGNMFDVRSKQSLTIQTFDIHSSATGTVEVKVFTKLGSYIGYESDPSAWGDPICHDTNLVGQGQNKKTPIPMSKCTPIEMQPDETRAFYVTLTTNNMAYTRSPAANPESSVYVSDEYLEHKVGVGKSYPFGSTYSPRIWNGVIHYLKGITPTTAPTTVNTPTTTMAATTTTTTTIIPTTTNPPTDQPTDPPTTTPTDAPSTAPTTSLSPCLNGGVWNSTTGICDCIVGPDDGYIGEKCELSCPATEIDSEWKICSGNGRCKQNDKDDMTKGASCVCDEGYMRSDCSIHKSGLAQLKETYKVKLIWGIGLRTNIFHGLWNKNSDSYYSLGMDTPNITLEDIPFQNSFDLSDPSVQMWLLETAKAVRNTSNLDIVPSMKTWIEVIEEEAGKVGISFPLQQSTFAGYVSLLLENSYFRRTYGEDIGTIGPGFSGNFTYASLTFLQVAGGQGGREGSLKRWNNFVRDHDIDAPPKAGKATVQSNAFTEVHRRQKVLSSTITTWAIANGLCLLIVLFFTQNIALSLIVMVTIVLLVISLLGFVLVVLSLDFGPIEAIGVTIFIGLSVDYALHVTHAYHNSPANDRLEKIKFTVFATGSPVIAAAVSTIGACGFLLGCRLWLLVELGILLCSNTAMALIFSMGFLLAILSIIGPVPIKGDMHLHQCDFRVICCRRRSLKAGLIEDDVPV